MMASGIKHTDIEVITGERFSSYRYTLDVKAFNL